MPKIEIKPATEADREFMFALYREQRQAEIGSFGWPQQQADAFIKMQFDARDQAYAMQFPSAQDMVIFVDGRAAGRLLIDRSADSDHVVDIAVMASEQGKGIGSQVIKTLQSSAEPERRTITLRVDRMNIGAIRFYKKHGFQQVDGSQLLISMRWPPVERKVIDPAKIGRRAVTEADREVLLEIYAASREIELAMVNWEPGQLRAFLEHQFDAQVRHYVSEYPNITHELILIDNEPAGRLFVSRGAEETAILDLTILPGFRSQGIATALITEVTAKARDTGRSVRIYIETFNPNRGFLEGLGFSATETTASHIRMTWEADDRK